MKILLVDDHALFRAGLRLLLTSMCRDVLIYEAETVPEALSIAQEPACIDLCLLDLQLKFEDGQSGIERLKQVAPRMAIVVVSGADDVSRIRACLDAGAMSFIPKSAMPEVLTLALRHVLDGTVYLPAQIVGTAQDVADAPTLTGRQMDVLRCLSRGMPTKMIARELNLSEYTVKDYIGLVFEALGVHNRTEAVIKASRLRMLDAGPGVLR